MNSRAALVTFLGILFILLFVFLRMIEPFVMAVMIGAILALLLGPQFEKLQKLRCSPQLSAVAITCLISLGIGLPLGSFSVLAIHEAKAIGEGLAKNSNFSYLTFSEKLAKLPYSENLVGDQASIELKIREVSENIGELISSAALKFLAHLPDLLLHMVLALFACFVFLLNGKRLSHWIFKKIPIDQDVEIEIITSLKKTSRSVVLSVLAAAGVESFLIFFGFLFLNVPGAFFAAGATFIFSFIPIISCSPVWISGALYLFLHAMPLKAVLMIGIGILTGIAENSVRPLVLRGSSNLHPLLGLIAILGGLKMFGLFGVLLGPILASLLVSLLEIWPIVGKRSGIKFGES